MDFIDPMHQSCGLGPRLRGPIPLNFLKENNLLILEIANTWNFTKTPLNFFEIMF
jgi:hypothetical protein